MVSSDVYNRDGESVGGQSGLRDQNARLLLSLIRRHGALPSAEIARRSGLSAQTVSNIIRSLEGDGLLTRGEALKGKVGKPSIPMALNPLGVYSLGLNIGRRSAELVLVDFKGKRLDQRRTSYPYPLIDDVFAFLKQSMAELLAAHPKAEGLIAGIGIGRPHELWSWLEIVKAPEDAMRAWRDIDLAAEVEAMTGLDVTLENDATSACIAEFLTGRGNAYSDFVYIYIGAFVGGGLVLNGKVVTGFRGNAAALGPLPVPKPDGAPGVTQLLNVASLYKLEEALRGAGKDPDDLRRKMDDWSAFEPWVSPWISQTGENLAIATAAIASVVDLQAVLIDGAMPEAVRDRLADVTRDGLGKLDLTGVIPPIIETATVGSAARSVGAALLPIHSRYFLA